MPFFVLKRPNVELRIEGPCIFPKQTWLYEDDLRQVLPSEGPVAHALDGALNLLEQRRLPPPPKHAQHVLQRFEHILQYIGRLNARISTLANEVVHLLAPTEREEHPHHTWARQREGEEGGVIAWVSE